MTTMRANVRARYEARCPDAVEHVDQLASEPQPGYV
jgi:hypothetical protein